VTRWTSRSWWRQPSRANVSRAGHRGTSEAESSLDDLRFTFNVARTCQPALVFDVMARAAAYVARRLHGIVLDAEDKPLDTAAARARVVTLEAGLKAHGLTPGSDAFRAALAEQSCVPVIPSNGSRAQKLPYDKERYKARSEIECTFSLLKQARRFATRYEKTLRNYAAVVALGCALLWLRI